MCPIYVYECDGCRQTLEFEQSIHDPPFEIHTQKPLLATDPPPCGGNLIRIIQAPQSIRIHGPGGRDETHRHKAIYKTFQPTIMDLKTGTVTEKPGPLDP